MKPLNLDNRPCSPISSNCVVWQGPDISCIHICNGDTVSDVVFALATELCTLLDQTNVNNYDLTCLGITACGPKDFQALIQLLIEKICELQDINVGTAVTGTRAATQTQGTCPDCIVTVAPCFRVGNQTTMQLLDYVNMIAEKVCALIDQINALQLQINNLDIRVTVLENATPPSFTLPSILVDCTLSSSVVGGSAYTIDLVLNALLNDNTNGYCSLIGATGLPSDLFSAVTSACITSTTSTLSKPPVPFGTQYLGSWVNSPTTVADTITNLWLVVCDIYTAFQNFDPPVSIVTAGDGIAVATTVVGNETTYEVSTVAKPGLSVYAAPQDNLAKTPPALSSGRLCDGPIQILDSIEYNDFGASYNATTGIFTVPVTGRYTMAFFSHFTRATGSGWYDDAVPGMWTAGIVSPTGCNFYCVNNDSPVVIQKHASINGSITRKFTAGTQLCVKVINLTNFDYVSQSGDVILFSVQRVD